jgi:tryptophan-rich sensory protein
MNNQDTKSIWPYIFIPLVTVVVSVIGSRFTASGMDGWYMSLDLPAIAPPGVFIGIAWTVIFILTTIAALLVWRHHEPSGRFYAIWSLFLINAGLNVFWSFLFFNQQLIGPAVVEAAVLGLSVVGLIVLIWPVSRLAATLLIPYAGWVTFATYLNYLIWQMN